MSMLLLSSNGFHYTMSRYEINYVNGNTNLQDCITDSLAVRSARHHATWRHKTWHLRFVDIIADLNT